MAITPERRAEIYALVDELLGPPRPKPKVIAVDGGVVRDADVPVSRADVNSGGAAKVIVVRRPDYVTINQADLERRYAEREAERHRRRQLDPCGLNLYGPIDE